MEKWHWLQEINTSVPCHNDLWMCYRILRVLPYGNVLHRNSWEHNLESCYIIAWYKTLICWCD